MRRASTLLRLLDTIEGLSESLVHAGCVYELLRTGLIHLFAAGYKAAMISNATEFDAADVPEQMVCM